jgi:hypothetical protein
LIDFQAEQTQDARPKTQGTKATGHEGNLKFNRGLAQTFADLADKKHNNSVFVSKNGQKITFFAATSPFSSPCARPAIYNERRATNHLTSTFKVVSFKIDHS